MSTKQNKKIIKSVNEKKGKISSMKNAKKIVKKTLKATNLKRRSVVNLEISDKKISNKAKKALINASSEEQRFWVNNGPVLRNLQDLHEALKSISKEQFAYHVHGKSNDFALWVEYILLDKKCAEDLKKAKTQKKASQIVGDVLKKYK